MRHNLTRRSAYKAEVKLQSGIQIQHAKGAVKKGDDIAKFQNLTQTGPSATLYGPWGDKQSLIEEPLGLLLSCYESWDQ